MRHSVPLFVASALGALTLTASAGLAQGVSFNDIDTNGTGFLERTELESALGTNAQAAMMKFDADGNGIVTLTEVREGNNAGGNGARPDRRDPGPGRRCHSRPVG